MTELESSETLVPVILAGGSGTRLWPLSRKNYPKQFLALTGEDTMLQRTIKRLDGLQSGPSIIVCNEEHRFIAAEQIKQIDCSDSHLLLEPVGRNTAPAIALAALYSQRDGDDPLLIVLAADHEIGEIVKFHESAAAASEWASKGRMVSLGVTPTSPETGYGYIKVGAKMESDGESFTIDSFVEKPDENTAMNYIESGDYYWNAGIFLFRASTYLTALKILRPDIYSQCLLAMEGVEHDVDFIRIDKKSYSDCPSESIDYAVMEKVEGAVVTALTARWSDVGSFESLWQISEKNLDGNVLIGDISAYDTKNTLVISDKKLIATAGVEDLVIISTKDAVLVASKDQAQNIKEIVSDLTSDDRSEAVSHRENYRPWGKYDSIDSGPRFQVKRITVNPGAKLSVQMHHHRAEHWVVVSGTAKVTIGSEQKLVHENQSVYIPISEVHALENPGKIDLELIEIQSGAYLGEDDIVRFKDNYGRV